MRIMSQTNKALAIAVWNFFIGDNFVTMKHIFCLALALIPASALAQTLPSGWTTKEQGNATIHTNLH
jgi:hypothetical protein